MFDDEEQNLKNDFEPNYVGLKKFFIANWNKLNLAIYNNLCNL